MRQKLKDVEEHPYMLAIYKDNEYGHLIRHAIKFWLARRPDLNAHLNAIPRIYANPLTFCQYPPLELVIEYYGHSSPMSFLSSRVLRCPVVAKWAFIQEFERLERVAELGDIGFQIPQVLALIDFDEELIYRIVTSPIGRVMPSAFYQILNDEQKATLAICA